MANGPQKKIVNGTNDASANQYGPAEAALHPRLPHHEEPVHNPSNPVQFSNLNRHIHHQAPYPANAAANMPHHHGYRPPMHGGAYMMQPNHPRFSNHRISPVSSSPSPMYHHGPRNFLGPIRFPPPPPPRAHHHTSSLVQPPVSVAAHHHQAVSAAAGARPLLRPTPPNRYPYNGAVWNGELKFLSVFYSKFFVC